MARTDHVAYHATLLDIEPTSFILVKNVNGLYLNEDWETFETPTIQYDEDHTKEPTVSLWDMTN